jgi:hypothetical protein
VGELVTDNDEANKDIEMHSSIRRRDGRDWERLMNASSGLENERSRQGIVAIETTPRFDTSRATIEIRFRQVDR